MHDLRRDEDVVTPRQVVMDPGAEESEALRENFEHAVDTEQAVLIDLRAEDPEDQVLLAKAADILDVEIDGHLGERLDVLLM